MEIWRFESNAKKQTFLSIVFVLVGVVLMIVARHNAAGFWLGALLALIGAYALVAGAKKQVTVVDFNSMNITVETFGLFSTKKRGIRFDDIADILIGRLGRSTTAVVFYSLVLKLKSGEEYTLFPPGYFYEDCFDRDVMEKRRSALMKAIALKA